MAAVTWENGAAFIRSIFGRHLGLFGDTLSATPNSGLIDEKNNVLCTARSPIIKAVTAVAVGPITLTGVAAGDIVLSATDLTTPGDGSAKFEPTITVANQIQQILASTEVFLIAVRAQS